MAITSKSLHHSNVVIVFDEARSKQPENNEFASLYSGEEARGVRFWEDPMMQTKMLILPVPNIKITLEGYRLRIDDEAGVEPKNSRIVKDLLYVKDRLFRETPITGYGFNYDVFYRFNNVIPIQHLFERFFDSDVLEKQELRHLGIQFTLESKKGEISDTWFLKIVSPLELAVHLNRHFHRNTLLDEKGLVTLFDDCYNKDIDNVIKSFEENF